MQSFTKRTAILALTLLSSAMASAYADASLDHVVVAPSCLLKNISLSQHTLTTSTELVLFETNDAGIETLIAAKHQSRGTCGGFMDVTHAWNDTAKQGISAQHRAKQFLKKYESNTPKQGLTEETLYDVKYQSQVHDLISKLNPQTMWSNLTTFSNMPDRYSRSDNGVKAAAWLKAQVETMAKNAGRTDVTVYYVQTGDRYKQPSVVAKFGDSNEAGVVIGGHMDTLAGTWGNMPGADDDGSGSMTVLETARVLLNSGMHFKKPIYFVWYSAEEVGLIGSQYVVDDFKRKNIPVDAVVQFDMTGYRNHGDSTLWLMDDYVNKGLSAFTETLINTYVKQPVKHSRCGYACSDHASWTQGGFKSSMPFETEMNHDNPDIHTSRDTMDNLSLDHMTSFAKLGIAFAVELAEPTA